MFYDTGFYIIALVNPKINQEIDGHIIGRAASTHGEAYFGSFQGICMYI